ncbi:MAG: class I SAM-dependent methyltransferase [Deltaproteobacteria bacterium]|uniref:Class I SAM-dependent methyltransferase n=1 Tax=Candidatus Zymogenus saltonus TaxID=2844893 RepID=A0A9D8PR50_9DELT|nr:class I SAM-dependent methyltransferase [Candidatus Zymogenus saltonus]
MTPKELQIMIKDYNKWISWLRERQIDNNLTFRFDSQLNYYKHWNPYANIHVIRDVWYYYKRFVKLARSIGAKRIMDHGCAFGVGSWIMAVYGFDVTGVEIIPEFISIGKKLFEEVKFVQAYEGKDLEVDGKFDLVLNCFSQRTITEKTIQFYSKYSDTCAHIIEGPHKIEVPGRYVDNLTYITSPKYVVRSYSMRYYLHTLLRNSILRSLRKVSNTG